MLTSLECRFDSIQQIDEFCVATILDPPFKHHFFMETETQQLAREYLIDIIATTFQPPNKRARHDHTTTAENNDQASSSKVWECFTELLEETWATSDVGVGVEGMVDSYLSEPLIDCNKGDPLKYGSRIYSFLGNMAQ